MRLGINMPLKDQRGVVLDGAGVAARARLIEAAGFDGIWMQDWLSPGPRADSLGWLLVAAAATQHVEVGTCVLQVPLRNPVELANRFLTLTALSRGRFVAGVGAGSTRSNHDAVGVDFEQRFRLLGEQLRTVRQLCRGETVGAAQLNPWPEALGGPPIAIGSWASGVWIKRAAQEYDGWMASGGRTTFATLREGIQRFRDAGGKRAYVSTVTTDLSLPEASLSDEQPFTLRCGPKSAAERLARLADLGFDDVLLVKADHSSTLSRYEYDFTEDDLHAMRALAPRSHP